MGLATRWRSTRSTTSRSGRLADDLGAIGMRKDREAGDRIISHDFCVTRLMQLRGEHLGKRGGDRSSADLPGLEVTDVAGQDELTLEDEPRYPIDLRTGNPEWATPRGSFDRVFLR
jgi:hypothetical protein